MNLNNLGNTVRAFALTLAGTAIQACPLQHPDDRSQVDCADTSLPELVRFTYCRRDAGIDAARKLDAVVDGRADAPEVTIGPDLVEVDVPQDTEMDAADAAIQPDVVITDVRDAAAEVFPDVVDETTDAGTDAPDVTIGPDLVEVDVADDTVTVPDASPPDSAADVRDAAVTDVIATPDSADDVIPPPDTTPPADTGADVPAEAAVDAGPACSSLAGTTAFINFETIPGTTILSAHTGTDTSFGTLIGGALASGVIGQGLRINADNQGFSTNDVSFGNFANGNFIISAWLILDTMPTTANRTIVARRGASGFAWRIQSTGAMRFTSLDATCDISSSSTIPNDGRAHNVMALRDSGNMTLYLDGRTVGSATCSYNFMMGNPVYWGASQVGSSTNTNLPLLGIMDRVTVVVGSTASSAGADQLYCFDRTAAGL